MCVARGGFENAFNSSALPLQSLIAFQGPTRLQLES
jgi:hypothetical protein